jgi:hypothetical protein
MRKYVLHYELGVDGEQKIICETNSPLANVRVPDDRSRDNKRCDDPPRETLERVCITHSRVTLQRIYVGASRWRA